MSNFKKHAVAAAVSTALAAGVAGTAQAVTLSEPGDALLVPYVLWDSANQVNTLIGITVPQAIGRDYPFGVYPTALGNYSRGEGECTLNPKTIHWYFFDARSNHVLDDELPVTCNDLVEVDWGALASSLNAAVADGVPGYLVFTGGQNAGGFAMFGDAAMIQGDWSSAAFIPVIPMNDTPDGSAASFADNVHYGTSNIPDDVRPLVAGMPLDNDDGVADDTVIWDMRYFEGDASLSGSTQFVVWMDTNWNASGVPIDVCDNDENCHSFQIDLPNELNVIDSGPITGTKDTGFIVVHWNERADSTQGDGPEHAAVAFSLIFFQSGANPQQVQTALAHERGVF